MNYRDKIMSYADVLQSQSSEGSMLIERLDQKIDEHHSNQALRDFWVEVVGRIHRNSLNSEISSFALTEKEARQRLSLLTTPIEIVASERIMTWASYLPKLQDELIDILDYYEEHNIRERDDSVQKSLMSRNSLMFFNTAIKASENVVDLFKYIPLVNAVYEGLTFTRNIALEFNKFLADAYVPVLRTHKKYALEFLDLVERESEFLHEDNNKGVLVSIETSTIFNRDFTPEPLVGTIPPKPAEGERDPYLEDVGRAILAIENKQSTAVYYDLVRIEWYGTPFTHLYKVRMLADHLGVTDYGVFAFMPDKLLAELDNVLYAHDRIFESKTLCANALLPIENFIFEHQDLPEKHLFHDMFVELLESLDDVLTKLLNNGVISLTDKNLAIKTARTRGAQGGLFSGYSGF